MKPTLLLLTLTLALAACSKQSPPTTTDAGPDAERPASVPVAPSDRPAPVATPAPAAPVVVATPTPKPVATNLAPEGVFYLIASVRVETSSGITTLKPGTGVKLVRPGTYLTPAGEQPLVDNQLTNDMDIARAARDADAATTAALAAARNAGNPARDPAPPSSASSAPNSQAVALAAIARQRAEANLVAMQQQKAALEVQIEALATKRSRERFNEIAKGRINASSTEAQLTAARTQLAVLNTQIAEAQRTLR